MSLTTDTLYVGMTRPTLVGGVTLPAFIANGMVSAVIFLGTNNILYLAVFIPIHGFFYLLCATEPRVFELVNLWTRTKGRNLNRRIWGSSSYTPFERFRAKPAKIEKLDDKPGKTKIERTAGVPQRQPNGLKSAA